ncbi:unnamed protein product [Gordionus sp. m RMFG-2023]
MTEPKSVLMVCLGNICRSPIAEACLRKILEESYITNWKVDSAGTGDYHLGKSPDHRAMAILKNHDINFSHKARQDKDQESFEDVYQQCIYYCTNFFKDVSNV